jgi:hypothetical protein
MIQRIQIKQYLICQQLFANLMQGVCPIRNNLILFHKAAKILQGGFNLK